MRLLTCLSRLAARANLQHATAAACALLLCAPAEALRPENIGPGEIALLPAFCTGTMGFLPGVAFDKLGPQGAYWMGLMGKDFRHMHHFCYGHLYMRRAAAAGLSPTQRQSLLETAAGQYLYVIESSEPNFVMLPDAYVYRGDAQAMLKDYQAALRSYEQGRLIKPDYWRPYSRAAEVLLTMNDPKQAMAQVEAGLRVAPNHPTLLAQYKRLGGDPAKLAALRQTAAAAAAAAASAARPEAAATPDAAASATP